MIEYLYNGIRITSSENNVVTAIITRSDGESITDGCHFMLFDKDDTLLATIDGEYIAEVGAWNFVIPDQLTKGKCGRYWYRVCSKEDSLCFKQPIYFCI